MESLLLYHLVQGEYPAAALVPPSTLPIIQGESLNINLVSYQILINDADFVLADVPATNGIFHIIDKVLVPPSMTFP